GVLSGNTKGFEWIEKLSQDVTRIYSAPPVILHPFPSPEESDEWDFIFNSTCSFYVLKRQSNDEVMSKLLWAVSGGIPRIAINIWIEAQKNRLYKKDNNQLQLKDLIDVYESEGLEKIRKIAKGFAMKDPILLKEFSDIPWKDYGKKWGKLGAQNIESEVAADNSVNQSVNDLEDTAKGRKVSEKSKMKSKQTRKKNKERQRSKVKKNLSPSDLRGKDDGLTQVLLDGLAGVV
ncbi:MAG: hypothetical protein HOG49_06730, partial [Candidatus Scalindua sp.]|nr:hypothetical protein [Candidatus Scalindua sp.]